MVSETLHKVLDFDLDRYLNPWIPPNRLDVLPKSVSRWLGYRSKPHQEPPAVLQWIITFIATVGSLCMVAGVYNYAPGIARWNPPVIVASLGASAVLDYNTIRSPLAQPRNAIIGNTLAAICGVAIAKLFQLNSDFHNIEWVAGAVGCGVASWVMSITGTIHPPGGATAILASTQAQIVAMGWRYVPLVLIGTALMTATALVFNNILRQYPVFWWTPSECGQKLRRTGPGNTDEEKGESEHEFPDTDSDRTLGPAGSRSSMGSKGSVHMDQVVITPYKLVVPTHVQLSDEERGLLEALKARLWANVV